MRQTLASIVAATALILFAVATASADPTATPAPSPTPSPSPSPPIALRAVFSATESYTSGVNATGTLDTPAGADLNSRFNVSNAFAILTRTSGTLQYALQAGAYSIPTVGVAGNKTIQTNANTGLYGAVPLAQLQYVPNASFNVSAGVLATLTGAESTFTYEDWNIQRGAVWNVENAVSRGVRAAFTSGKSVVTLGADDGFYSGKYGAAEASLTYNADPNDSLLFVYLDPNPRTPPNPTASVANKSLSNIVFTRTEGKLQLAPYLLWARSPATSALGYTSAESAFGAAVLANETWSPTFSTAVRWETLHQSSNPTDASPNADLVGYGAGSGIGSWTITPEFKMGGGTWLRFDVSSAHVSGAKPGLAFGTDGKGTTQSRIVLELGTQI